MDWKPFVISVLTAVAIDLQTFSTARAADPDVKWDWTKLALKVTIALIFALGGEAVPESITTTAVASLSR